MLVTPSEVLMRNALVTWSIALGLTACGSTSVPPVRLQILESSSSTVPHAASSGGMTRWESESTWYFSDHDAASTGINVNPYSFTAYLDNLPANLALDLGGTPWTRIAKTDTPDAAVPSFAYSFAPIPGGDPNNPTDLRNWLIVSPARTPMQIDHGQKWLLGITDRGGSASGQAPITTRYTFAFVARGRCRVQHATLSQNQPAPNTTVSLSASVGPSCKRVWVTAATLGGSSPPGFPPVAPRDPTDPLFDSTTTDIGTQRTISVSRLITNRDVAFRVVAIDAAGVIDSSTATARVQPPQQPPPTATQCPTNPGGLPQQQRICVSCPTFAPGQPGYKATIVGDYCSSAAAIADLQSQYGGCQVTSTGC
jgi:hypothetical protein